MCYFEATSTGLSAGRADPEFIVHISEAPPGEGVLDLEAFLEVVRNIGEGTAVIVEQLPTDRAVSAIEYVKWQAVRRELTFL